MSYAIRRRRRPSLRPSTPLEYVAWVSAALFLLLLFMVCIIAGQLSAPAYAQPQKQGNPMQMREPIFRRPTVIADPRELCTIDLHQNRHCPDLCTVIPEDWRDHVCGQYYRDPAERQKAIDDILLGGPHVR